MVLEEQVFTLLDGEGNDYVGSEDPFEGENAPVVSREPEDYPEGIANQDEYSEWLRDNYFRVAVRDDLDPTDNNWTFQWYNEYYFLGIYQELMDTNPYLEQTEGWGGSFDPLANSN